MGDITHERHAITIIRELRRFFVRASRCVLRRTCDIWGGENDAPDRRDFYSF